MRGETLAFERRDLGGCAGSGRAEHERGNYRPMSLNRMAFTASARDREHHRSSV
jgi:hypothetical protein